MGINHPDIDEPGYLIPVFNGNSADFNSLVDIFVEVLDGMEGANNIYVGSVLEE